MPKPRRRSGPLCRAPHLEAVSHCPTTRRGEPYPGARNVLVREMSGMSGETPINACLGASTTQQSVDPFPLSTPCPAKCPVFQACRRPTHAPELRRPGLGSAPGGPACVGHRNVRYSGPVDDQRMRRSVDHRLATAAGPSWSIRPAAPELGAMGLCSTTGSNEPLLPISEQRAVASQAGAEGCCVAG